MTSPLRPSFRPVSGVPADVRRRRPLSGGSVVVVRQRPRWDGQDATDQAAEVEAPAAPVEAATAEEIAAAVVAVLAPDLAAIRADIADQRAELAAGLAGIADQIHCVLLEVDAMRSRWLDEFPPELDPERFTD